MSQRVLYQASLLVGAFSLNQGWFDYQMKLPLVRVEVESPKAWLNDKIHEKTFQVAITTKPCLIDICLLSESRQSYHAKSE